MNEKDPITLVYESIWTALESDADFASLVPSRLRIKLTGNIPRFPTRDIRQPESVGQVAVALLRVQPDVNAGSYAYHLVCTFGIYVYSNDQRLSFTSGGRYYGLNALLWVVFKALSKWPLYMENLTYKGKPFVVNWAMRDGHARFGASGFMEQSKPNMPGWMLTYVCEASLLFERSQI